MSWITMLNFSARSARSRQALVWTRIFLASETAVTKLSPQQQKMQKMFFRTHQDLIGSHAAEPKELIELIKLARVAWY
jgi:hypothetical protein